MLAGPSEDPAPDSDRAELGRDQRVVGSARACSSSVGRRCTYEQSQLFGGVMSRGVAVELPEIATVERRIGRREGRSTWTTCRTAPRPKEVSSA